MKLTELNPAGHFEPWSASKIKELKNIDPYEPLGNSLLFENESIKLWNISLMPGERLPFRIQKTNYNWICLTGGLAISRFDSGKICLLRLEKEDIGYWEFTDNKVVCDFENIGEDILNINLIEYKPITIVHHITKYL